MTICAKDIMSEHVVVIHEDMLIWQAAHLMLRDRVSSFPVADENGKLIGIVTMTDLFVLIDQVYQQSSSSEFQKKIAQLKDRQVKDIMSKDVVTISPQSNMNDIIRFVVDQGIHSFPVVEQDKIVGIVSRHDILNTIFSCIS
jgi:CBS domain-containing protein